MNTYKFAHSYDMLSNIERWLYTWLMKIPKKKKRKKTKRMKSIMTKKKVTIKKTEQKKRSELSSLPLLKYMHEGKVYYFPKRISKKMINQLLKEGKPNVEKF